MNEVLDLIFPEELGLNIEKQIAFSTQIIQNNNNLEFRILKKELAVYRYFINLGIIKNDSYQKLNNFFLTTKGCYFAFKFKDILDFKVEKETVKKITNRKFQLQKNYIFNDYTFKKDIKNIKINSLKVYINNEIYNNFLIDHSTGILEFQEDFDNANILVDFEYFKSVRFESDILQFKILNFQNINIEKFSLIELI